ncbi:exonuclease/endonuclease/phosphatase family protein [Roseimaritima ulvae]|uniref:Endonuclease/Exonuclease/phosphatase family protein n=1 Tax=Roseimaritima ulvae TaxID=980254 RepID=A0A5B9R1L7_9BACT|nr:hypothetical protein [Roseimaritima ulvae]QEG40223.1 hypothetical protein UC8_22300 [Roseimaritima ulvae]
MRSALLVILLLGGGWYFFRHYEIDGLDGVELRPKSIAAGADRDDDLRGYLDGAADWRIDNGATGIPGTAYTPADFYASDSAADGTEAQLASFGGDAAAADGDTAEDAAALAEQIPHPSRRVRVASWALGGFGKDKAAKPHVMGWLARVIRSFDVIAVQQITGPQRDLLPRIVEHVNRSGRRYDFLIAPPQLAGTNPYGPEEQLAFVFDTERVVTDRGQFYTVADPANVMTHDPIVGWFRVVGPKPDRAWTFSVVNVRVEMDVARREVAALREVMQAVTQDGRHEDDTLMVGLFQADDAYLRPSLGQNRVVAAVEATPTDIFGRHQVSNVLLDPLVTTEYLGTGGVVNFLRLQNLTLAECEELTPHLPVYAEFSPVEGL